MKGIQGKGKQGKLNMHFSSKSHKASMQDFVNFCQGDAHIEVLWNREVRSQLKWRWWSAFFKRRSCMLAMHCWRCKRQKTVSIEIEEPQTPLMTKSRKRAYTLVNSTLTQMLNFKGFIENVFHQDAWIQISKPRPICHYYVYGYLL